MDGTDIISAGYMPGFSPVLTSWRVFVGRNRWLRQKVVVYDHTSPYHNRVLWFWAKLARPQMSSLREIVGRIDFGSFDRCYTHQTMCITDCPSYYLAVLIGGRVKEVEAYDLYRLADYERQPAAIGLKELWEAVSALAPFGKVPIERGLPRPWWRLW